MKHLLILLATALLGCSPSPVANMPAQELRVGGQQPLLMVGSLDTANGRLCVEAAVASDAKYVIHSMRIVAPQNLSYQPDRWRDRGSHPLPPTGDAFAGEGYTQPTTGRYVQACWDTRYTMFSPPVGQLQVNLLCVTCEDVAVQRLAFTMEVLSPPDGSGLSRVVFTPSSTEPPGLRVPVWPEDGRRPVDPPLPAR